VPLLSVKPRPKQLSRIVASTALVALLLVGLSGLVLTLGITIGNWKLMAIRSGSMRPHWARGSLLILTPEPASAVRVGQEIEYQPPRNLFDGVIVHQVIAIEKTGPGEYVAQTKGSANPVQDPWRDYLHGTVEKVDVALPWLGMIPITLSHL
jgi:signal peptidase I